MNRNILLLCEYKSVYGGNFIPSLMKLDQALLKDNDHCIYCFPIESRDRNWVKRLVEEGKNIYFIDFNVNIMKMLKSIRKVVMDASIDLIHSHHVSTLLMDLYSIYDPSTSIVIHLHSDFTNGKISLRKKIQDYFVYKFFAKNVKMISVSEAFRNLNPKKIRWIPNALAHHTSKYYINESRKLRKRITTANNAIIFEIFGWSPVVKGLDIAIEAIKRVQLHHKNAILLIVCGRNMTTSKIKNWIIDNTSCTGEEEFLKFVEPREDVFTIHEASDVLLSASRSEGFPYAILEMLSIGKHVISSDIQGTAWAKNYPTALYFKSEDIEACADKIKKVIDENLIVKDEFTAERILIEYGINDWTKSVIEEYNTK